MKGIADAGREKGLRARRWDAIVLGGALPGLVAAARLAMDGQRVLVLEEDAAARAHPGLREPFFLAGAASGGILDACLKTLTVPLIDRKKIEPDPIAYQLVLPDARIDVGEPNTTAEELVAWGLAKPDEAQELVRGVLEAAHAERAAMLEASVVRAGGLRALARGAVAPRPSLHGRGLPVGLSSPSAALLPFLEAQLRALSNLADATPAPEARGRLLGSALEGGAGFAAASEGGLRGLLKRRIQALFGELRAIHGRFELVTVGNAPGITMEGSHDVWVGRVLIVNAPRHALAAVLADAPGGAPNFLDAPAPTRQRVSVQLRVRRSVLPEGMARRVIRVLDADRPREGTNVVWMQALPSPHGGDFVDLIATSIVPAAIDAADAAAAVEAAVRGLMPFSERDVSRERAPELRWDLEGPGDPSPGEGWPGDVEIRLSSRPPIYVLPREAVAALGFEGDLLLGWRAGDVIRADVQGYRHAPEGRAQRAEGDRSHSESPASARRARAASRRRAESLTGCPAPPPGLYPRGRRDPRRHQTSSRSECPDTRCTVMAQVCQLCGKHPSTGHNVSHSNRKTHRRWNVNLQATRALVDGVVKRIRVCTRCIRSGRVTKVA